MLLLISLLTLLNFGHSRDYQYPRPPLPFPTRPDHVAIIQQPQRYIVQTLGPNGRTYELQAHKSPAIYVAHQTVSIPGVQQVPQYYSANNNPLLVNTNYQPSPAVALTAPPPPPAAAAAPISYYGPVQVQGQHVQQSADSYYRQPQALTVATAAHSQPPAQYGPPHLQVQPHSQPQGQPQSHALQHQQPQTLPYAIVTLPTGQHVWDAGHGAGAPTAASGQPELPGRIGDYSAQSPNAALDIYNYKQSTPGDTRNYQRFIQNCQPNGACQQLTLNPGQIEGDHQSVLHAARSQTKAAASNCKKEVYVPPGAEMNAAGQLRPLARRQKTQAEQLARYPYN